MNMKYTPNETITKLMMLYLFKEIQIPLSENSVIDICTSRNNWVKYIDYKNFLNQMLSSNLLAQYDGKRNENFYFITKSGRECLESFENEIPVSIKDNIREFVQIHAKEIKSAQEHVYEIKKVDNDTFNVNLRIYDISTDNYILSVSIILPDNDLAKKVCETWQKNADDISEQLINSLIG